MPLTHEGLTGKIIACAIAVHKALGPGFLESIYEAAMLVELRHAGLKVESQKPVPIYYRGIVVGEHRLDLFVEDLIVTELKAISGLEDIHFAITRSQIKAAGKEHGLLLNFAAIPLTVKRVILPPRRRRIHFPRENAIRNAGKQGKIGSGWRVLLGDCYPFPAFLLSSSSFLMKTKLLLARISALSVSQW